MVGSKVGSKIKGVGKETKIKALIFLMKSRLF
jgi:hypothetical protein